MKILITNDDGMAAGQLEALIRWCRKRADVTAVVPRYEQSGKSHAIELHKPFAVTAHTLAPGIDILAVDSSPADCVRFAILGMHKAFDLVISGINRGFNIGTDIIYSGTVGAACEAAALGVPAIAVSTSPDYYDHALEHLDRIFDYIACNRLMEAHSLYNINIPAGAGPIRITHQGGPYYSDDFAHVEGDLYEPRGRCVYRDRNDMTLDTDAVMHGHISITPLTIDRTDPAVYRRLAGLCEKGVPQNA